MESTIQPFGQNVGPIGAAMARQEDGKALYQATADLGRSRAGKQFMDAWSDTTKLPGPNAGVPEQDFMAPNKTFTDAYASERQFYSQQNEPIVDFANRHIIPQEGFNTGQIPLETQEQVNKEPFDTPHPDGGVISDGKGRMANEDEIRAANPGLDEVHVRNVLQQASKNKIPTDVLRAARETEGKYGIPAMLTTAQWALESGHGKSMPKGSNNPFGIKALPGQDYVEAATHEKGKGGKLVPTMAKFAKFDNINDAFEAHGKLLAEKPAYKKALENPENLDQFVKDISKKYATDPKYVKKLMKVIKSQV